MNSYCPPLLVLPALVGVVTNKYRYLRFEYHPTPRFVRPVVVPNSWWTRGQGRPKKSSC